MFYFDKFYGKKILKSSLLDDYDCFFTTREFVLTPADRVDLTKEAEENRKFLKEKTDCIDIYTAKQIHSANIQVISKDKTFYDDTDALISYIEGSLIILNYADCTPVILYSKKNNIGAVIHAGWRGTEAEITKKTAMKMIKEFNINPCDITALIGPCIGKCCFETDEDVFLKLVKNVKNTQLYDYKNNKYYIDLKLLNKNQLLETGIINIDISSYCTCCMSDIFFSYRKEKGKTARHSAVVKIKRG